MNTKESNYLIASFLGFIPKEYEKRIGTELQYHKSWDWLMPVVEKCTKLGIDYTEEGEKLFLKIGVSLTDMAGISSVYISVVEFINWYNENK